MEENIRMSNLTPPFPLLALMSRSATLDQYCAGEAGEMGNIGEFDCSIEK
jgi:hypothetical protein